MRHKLGSNSRFTGKSRTVIKLAAVFLLAACFLTVRPSEAVNKRVVTIYADGEQRTISTTATEVGEVLAKAGVPVHEHDLVEPALDTQILGNVFSINVFRARPVTIVDGDQRKVVMSPYQSPRLIAESAGVKVYPEDGFKVSRIDDITTMNLVGQELRLKRAVPLTINLYGEMVKIRTQNRTVEEVLAEKGIKPKKGDVISPELSDRVTKHDLISVVKVGTKVQKKKEKVQFETETIQDSNMLLGTRTVRQAGKPGRKLVTYEVKLHNGKPVKKRVLHTVIISRPVKEVVVVGTKNANPDSNTAIGQQLAARRGWTGSQWTCLYDLWMHESGWNHLASNGSSGAYGIPQALPGSKMGSVASDWMTNPATQITWGLNYIQGRYGTPCGAFGHWQANNWY